MAINAGFSSSSKGPTAVGSVPSTTLPHLGAIDGTSIRVSFEFFPPKTPAMEEQVWNAIRRLAPVAPSFFSVTYGAGGSTRDRTHRLATEIQAETRIPAAAHLTCVDATIEGIDAVADAYWQAGIRHIVALRGDPSNGVGGTYRPTQGGYAYADALVAGLRRLHPFDISVAAYPETHPSAASPEADIDALKRKIDAGANRAITQFFFDTEAFERFLERVVRAGITVPIVPGILPVTNVARTAEFAKSCGASIPDWVSRQFDGLDADPTTRQMVATLIAAEQCRTLYGLGIRDFHFYTLNRAELALGVCHALGVRAGTEASAQGNRSHG